MINIYKQYFQLKTMTLLDRRTLFDLNPNDYEAFYPALPLADNL